MSVVLSSIEWPYPKDGQSSLWAACCAFWRVNSCHSRSCRILFGPRFRAAGATTDTGDSERAPRMDSPLLALVAPRAFSANPLRQFRADKSDMRGKRPSE